MAVYIGYLLLAGIQIPFFRWKDELGKTYFREKGYLILCCIELILLAGIRGYTIGADTTIYLSAIDYYGSLPKFDLIGAKLIWPFDFEIGYFALTKFCAFLGLGKTSFLFVIAIITYIPIFISIKKHSPIPYISILCYFAFGLFSYSLGVFRQMIAVSILLCGWNFIVERKLFKYIIVVGIAMLFHTTAIIALALYFLYRIRWQNFLWALLGVEVFLLAFGRYVVKLAVKLLPAYAGYLGGEYDIQGGSYLMLLLLNVVLVASIFFRQKDDCNEDMIICALFLAVCLQAVGYSMEIFGRIVPYFSIYLLFAIPNVINNVGKRWKNLLVCVATGCLFFLAVRSFSVNSYVTPYYTFFSGFLFK